MRLDSSCLTHEVFTLNTWLRERMLPLAQQEDNAVLLNDLARELRELLYPRDTLQEGKDKAIRRLSNMFRGLRLNSERYNDSWTIQGERALIKATTDHGKALAWLPLSDVLAAEKH